MKKIMLFITVLFVIYSGTAYAEEGGRNIASLDKDTFVVVKDRGFNSSAIELFKIEDGQIVVKDVILVKEDRLNQKVKFFRFEKVIEDIQVR
jgi:hypothetical protein